MQVADLGHSLLVVDPAGARVGAWQPLAFRGFAVRGEVSAPAWFETLSTSYDESVAFYTDVFDWDASTMSDTAEFRYTTLGKDESAKAGILDAGGFLQGAPSTWQLYLQVADTDASVETAVAAGGRTVSPAEDTPYGRVAMLEDPVGTRFAVMGPALSTG
jgi:predicted enzyme related to lactoylglutathione lyase